MSPYVPTALIRAQSDERLARLAALGSERAFESIVERYRQPLLAYARRLVGDSRAEDVVQASFVAAWTDLRRGSEIREVRAWLYRVVHNRALNLLKRSDNSDVPLLDVVHASGPGVAVEVEDRDAIRATLQEIANLPERQRVALLAVAVDGRRHRDVGDELGLSEGAVKMLVNRARGTLRSAAGAFFPLPLFARLAGFGGGAGSSTGAGIGTIGAGALKAGAVLATAGALATAGPPALHAIEHSQAPAASATSAARPSASLSASAGATVAPVIHDVAARRHQARRHAAAPVSEPQVAAQPAAPVPAAAVTALVAAAPATSAPVQRTETNSSVPGRDFLQRASTPPVDDDIIVVVEDPPDIARGEQPIPPEGVSDAIANSVPGDIPETSENYGPDDPNDPGVDVPDATATDPAPADPAVSAPADPATTSRDVSATDLSQ